MNVVDQSIGENHAMYCGDSTEVLRGLPDNSVDLSVYSPPFSQLYVYSASDRDLGNSGDDDEFFAHYHYIISDLLRVTKPGRVTAVHVADIAAMMSRDGYIGLKDFSGDVIRAYIAGGWVFDARIPIDKNQQAQSIRTHSKALTMTSMEKDRSWIRPALPDYILKFRKPGKNEVLVNDNSVNRNEWIEFANPTWPNDDDRAAECGGYATWLGIHETDTLQYRSARESKDERHICPLQLGTIERCVRLWSNRGETVLDPFAGIGSTGHVSVQHGRRFIGVELKASYFNIAVSNLKKAEAEQELPLIAMMNQRGGEW